MSYESPAALPPAVLGRQDVRGALERHDFGAMFALARKWGGISFVKIADACDMKPERVGQLAKGKGAITTYEKMATIADGLRIPGHMIGMSPRSWEGKEAHCNHAEEAEGEALRRREFVTASMTAMAISADFPIVASGNIGQSEVARLRERTARLRRLDDFVGGAHTYPIYVDELESTVRTLRHASYLEPTGRALLSLVAEQAQQAGWAAFDAGQHAEAERLYRFALKAATDADDKPLSGNSLAILAYQQVSTTRSGVDTAAASCVRIGEEAPARVRALLFERLAWAHATAGDAGETERALARAEEALSQVSETEPGPDWAMWVDGCELQIMTGRCWTELGRPLRAVPPLENALRGFSDTQARDKALYMSWLAHAYLDAGEVEQAAAVTGRALELGTGVGSVRPQQRVRTLLRRLDRHRSVPEVAELLERVRA